MSDDFSSMMTKRKRERANVYNAVAKGVDVFSVVFSVVFAFVALVFVVAFLFFIVKEDQ